MEYLRNKVVDPGNPAFLLLHIALCTHQSLSQRVQCIASTKYIFILHSLRIQSASQASSFVTKRQIPVINQLQTRIAIKMKLQFWNTNINFFLGLVLPLICVLRSATTTARPLTSLSQANTDSTNLNVRSPGLDSSSQSVPIFHALAKRDFNFVHGLLIVVILAITAVVFVWWKCRARKIQQGKDMEDGDSKFGMGGMCRVM